MSTTTTTARKAIKTISVQGLTGAPTGLLSATTDFSYDTEVDSIAAYGDAWVTNVPRVEGKTFGEMTFEFLDEGDDVPDTLIGQVKTVTITDTYHDGKGTPTTKSVTFDFVIEHAGAGEVSIDGEKKSTITITGVPHVKPSSTESAT